MATYNKIGDWVENEGEVADLDNDSFVVALSNTAPGSEGTPPTGQGAGILANVTEITYTNLSSRTLTLAASGQSPAGTYYIDFNDLVLTSSGGSTGPFRYVYIYDDTPTSPADPLVCYFDYGSSITLLDTETLTITFNGSGLYTKT
jgi:hypothetical protein